MIPNAHSDQDNTIEGCCYNNEALRNSHMHDEGGGIKGPMMLPTKGHYMPSR